MKVFSVGGGALLDRSCMVFQRICVCACNPSAHLSVPSMGFVRVFVCRKSYPHLRGLRAGSQVFALITLVRWMLLHTMWSGKILQLLFILPFSMLCLPAISMMFVKIMLAVCMLVGMDGVLRELCPVSFLEVGESPSVLL